MIDQIRDSDVTFIADYHSFDQSQRTALRIIREVIEPGSSWAIGLEMISSHFQDVLDLFQDQRISVREFLKKISYTKEWGFPWRNYAPLFEWASAHRIRLIGLNTPKHLLTKHLLKGTEEKDLLERDRWAAERVVDLFCAAKMVHQHFQMIVLYGDLHVATPHLPRQLDLVSRSVLGKKLNWTTLHQNEDRLFWRLAEEEKHLCSEAETEIVQLKKRVYCVMSSTPWAKLQSWINWVNGDRATASIAYDGSDALEQFRLYGKALAEFFQIEPPSFEDLNVATIDQISEGSLGDLLKGGGGISESERRLIQFLVSRNIKFFIPHGTLAYLGTPSQNGIMELSAIYLLSKQSVNDHFFRKNRETIFRLLLQQCFAFFGSLILNPKRKCDLLADHRTRLEALETGSRPFYPAEDQARKLTLKLLTGRSALDRILPAPKIPNSALWLATQYVGTVLGSKLYRAVLKEKLQIEEVRRLFFDIPHSPSPTYQERFEALRKRVHGIQLPLSKRSRL